MQALTRGQLMYIIDQLYGEDENNVIFKEGIDHIFDLYGDGYYKDYGTGPFELVEENPTWKEGRGKFGWIPSAKE